MKKLVLLENKKVIGEIQLLEGKEHFIGRNADSDIVLPASKGISRQHFKIYISGDKVVVEALSQFAQFKNEYEGQGVIEIASDCQVLCPPFDLKFEGLDSSLNSDNQLDASPAEDSVTTNMADDNTEVTSAGVGYFKAQLIATYSTGEQETFSLDNKNSWVAGRDPHCDIYLRDDHVSRRHFEITRNQNESFSITELGSSNGSVVNGTKLDTHVATSINSGESIVISKVSVEFRIIDESFGDIEQEINDNLINLPALSDKPIPQQKNEVFDPSVFFEESDNSANLSNNFETENRKKKIKFAILALIPIIIYGLFSGDGKDNIKDHSSASKVLKLKGEDLAMVKDALALAQSHFNKGSFSLCLSEVSKVHNLIPSFQNSTELENYCQIGLEQARISEDKERLEKERKITEAKIQNIVDYCKEKINEFRTVDSLNQCLADAIEMDPSNLSIEELRNIITVRQQNLDDQQNREKNRLQRLQSGKNKYYRAVSLYKKGQLRNSISAFKTYLNGGYTELAKQNKNARRKLASVKSELNSKVSSLLKESKDMLSKGNYKGAYNASVKALKEDPKNMEAKKFKKQVKQRLAIDMKLIYENSIIEENYGNIAAAKENWLEITTRDFKNGSSFYKKAKTKLKKYGL